MSNSQGLVVGLLVHQNYSRVISLLNFFIESGIRAVVHVDKNAIKLAQRVSLKYENELRVKVISSNYCKWGEWSLVQAELDIYQEVVRAFGDCSHVHFMSGSDMPLRPVDEILQFLGRNKNIDFVELVDIERERFIVQGSHMDRLVYRYPFNFLHQRMLFEASLKLQKLFRLRRALPSHLKPHMGGQFKTLQLSTVIKLLEVIKNEPKVRHFFSNSWIPDESFIPTLIATLSSQGELEGEIMPSLTYRVFDNDGKPINLKKYQLEHYRDSQFYFARKYSVSEDIDFSYLDGLKGRGKSLFLSEVFGGTEGKLYLLIWDSNFDESHVALAKGAAFYGALEEQYDHMQDRYIEWDENIISERELSIWRRFRQEAPKSYLRELAKLKTSGVALSMHVDSIKKYGFEDLIKDCRITLVIVPRFKSDLRFEQIINLRKSSKMISS